MLRIQAVPPFSTGTPTGIQDQTSILAASQTRSGCKLWSMALKGFPMSIRCSLSARITGARQPELVPAATQPEDLAYGTNPFFPAYPGVRRLPRLVPGCWATG